MLKEGRAWLLLALQCIAFIATDSHKNFIAIHLEAWFCSIPCNENIDSTFFNQYFIMKLRMLVANISRCAMNQDKRNCSYTFDIRALHKKLIVQKAFFFQICFEELHALHLSNSIYSCSQHSPQVYLYRYCSISHCVLQL